MQVELGLPLTPEIQAFLREKVLVHLATVMKDGSPQVTPVWVDTDGTYVIVNTAEGRTKTRNIKRDARVALSVTDATKFQRMLVIRGSVVKVTTDGAVEHITEMARKYTGASRYTVRSGETRVKVFIEPHSIVARGM